MGECTVSKGAIEMGICRFCGQNAGILRNVHPECEQRYEASRNAIFGLVFVAITSGRDTSQLWNEIQRIACSGYVSWREAVSLVQQAWCQALDYMLADGVLTQEEEDKLINSMNNLEIVFVEPQLTIVREKLAMGRALRQFLLTGQPPVWPVSADLPFNFLNSEQLVWVFSNVRFLEEKTYRRYVGSSHSVSIRLSKGVYYRIGEIQRERIEESSIEEQDCGQMALTTKHLYFAGSRRSVRIPYKKIVAFQPYTDGIGVMREGANAKLQIYITGNGWFTYNLAMNLAARSQT